MEIPKKKILVAIDHSGQSLDAALYISRMVDPDVYRVVLFHVESDLFDIFYDYEETPSDDLAASSHFSDWIEVQKRSIDINLEHARKLFIESNFKPEDVTILKQPRINGITRDIIIESHKGYDILVTGKSGINRITDAMTGTVTSKLMSRSFHIPLVIVSGCPDTGKVLLGYDGSAGANHAVSTSSWLLKKTVSEILLFHVIRSFNISNYQYNLEYASFYNTFLPEMEDALIKVRREKMEPLLIAARQVYINVGFDPSKVTWTMINRSGSRAKTIIDAAKEQNTGTVILGRRGQSAVEEFFMGRVGRKAVEMAKGLAIWII